MEQSDLMRKLSSEFERLGIPYFVTGSMATIKYGEVRFTNDIDVVVQLTLEQVDAFCAAFPAPEFYCSKEAAADAVRRRFQFNVVHPASGLKVDVIVSSDNDLDRSRFARRRFVPAASDVNIWLSSPEDVIIKKLQYYKEGGSEKHVRDIIGVLKATDVDRAYIASWADRLQLQGEWREVVQRVE